MFLVQVLLPALLVVSINALRSAGHQICGTPDPTEEQIEASKLLLELERSTMRSSAQTRREIKVDTYFHILAAPYRQGDEFVTQQQVEDQLAVMNDAFSPHGISFDLINVTWSINATWHNGWDDLGFKRALRQGDYSALNVYVLQQFTNRGLLGYVSRLPASNITQGSDEFYDDGCVIKASTMPGGYEDNYNLGGVAVHEIGHWFNLLHTFHGSGCEDGDLIDDTPAQHEDAKYDGGTCPPDGKDSCPKSPGFDPVHNYMSYSSDECWNEFTRGQTDRMYSSWETHRRNATL